MDSRLVVDSQRNLLLIWDRLGDYHLARYRALTKSYKEGEVHIAQLGKSDVLYQWQSQMPQQHFWELSSCAVNETCFFGRVFRFIRLVRQQQIKVIVIPGYAHLSYVGMLMCARLMGVRSIIFAESWYPGRWWLDKLKEWFLNIFVDGIFVSGQRARSFFENRLGQAPAKIRSGYSVVDNAHFKRTVANEQELGYILCVARYSAEKDLMTLISAYRNSAAYQKLPLWLVGDGPLRGELISAIGEDSEWIKLKGWVNYRELPAIYHNASLFVLPSRFEPWGLVINEAIAAGVPVICSECCGAAELVSSNYQFEVGNYRELVKLLDERVSNNILKEEACKQYKILLSLNCFTWSNNLIMLTR